MLFTDHHSNLVKSLTFQLLTQSFSRTTKVQHKPMNLCPWNFTATDPYNTMRRTIHVHKNDNSILRVVFLLILSFTLTGCALTRVSANSHDKDVDELNVIGLDLDTARQRAIVDGFVCSKDASLNLVQTESGNHKWLQTECSKKSLELFCPQMRFMVLNVDPNTNKVVDVGKYITQHTCF